MFRNIMKFEKAIASLPGAIQPTKVDGKWRAPEMSRRKFAELRKAAIALNRCALRPFSLALSHTHAYNRTSATSSLSRKRNEMSTDGVDTRANPKDIVVTRSVRTARD